MMESMMADDGFSGWAHSASDTWMLFKDGNLISAQIPLTVPSVWFGGDSTKGMHNTQPMAWLWLFNPTIFVTPMFEGIQHIETH
jgi:hypothetical protein